MSLSLFCFRKFTVPRVLQQLTRSNKKKDGIEEYDEDEDEEEDEEEEGEEGEKDGGNEKGKNESDGMEGGVQASKVCILFF